MPPWVFLTPAGHPVDGDNLRRRVFYRLLEQAGLRKIRLHDLRHTYRESPHPAGGVARLCPTAARPLQCAGHGGCLRTPDPWGQSGGG